MKKFLIVMTVVMAVVAAACSDDADTSVGSDEPTDDGTVVDGPTSDDDDGTSDDGTVDPSDGEPTDGPGDDVPLGAGPYPIADLTITYQLAEDDDPVAYQLACLGDTATVMGEGAPTTADRMCLALHDDAVRDRVVHGPPTDVACTEQYGGPQIATIVGTLDGEEIDTSFDRANGCGIGDWDLFGDFLPSAG
ncbi:MAG: hypothetical protein R8F63_15330 [Acidimicrobiales bacterium]|nr:hypothetical protein [Acidimicrobiales bacterium]